MKEHVFSTNAFGMPKVFDSSDAQYALIIRLLMLEPGKFQSHPNMGVGIHSRYHYQSSDDNFLASLSSDIKNQISTYLPSISLTNVDLTMQNNVLGIIIDTAGGSYVVGYNGDSGKIDAAASYLLEDL